MNILESYFFIIWFAALVVTVSLILFSIKYWPNLLQRFLSRLVKPRSQPKKTKALYKTLAQQAQGEYRERGIRSDPAVRFFREDITAILSQHRFGRNSKTRYHRLLLKPYLDHQARLEVYPQRHFHRAIKLLAMDDVIIGDPSFDERYAIATSDENTAKNLLTPDVRTVIEQLRELHGDDNIYVNLVGGDLELRKPVGAFDLAFLQAYVALGMKLMKAMYASGQAGMVFTVNAVSTEDPICQICGESISTAVTCRRCDTPHHRDCWEYYGSCAVYSCGGKRFRKSKTQENI